MKAASSYLSAARELLDGLEQTEMPAVVTDAHPDMIYDFGGFPDALFKIVYPAPGQPEVAMKVAHLVHDAGLQTGVISQRGFDHGTWVPLSLIPALFDWHWPHGVAWLWLLATGIFGTGAQLLWTRALKLGEVSALTPISFMQLPVVAVAGWLLFDENPSRWTVIGVAIIFIANVYIAHREAQLARRAATHAPVEAAKPSE